MKTLLLTLLLLFLTACGGNSSGDLTQSSGSDFNLSSPPITSGNWYKPDVNSSWQWQLQGTLNSSYDVEIYDIDLFDTNATTITDLKNSGKRVICYFSAGSYEDWRDDAGSFDEELLGNTLDGWAGERWLDISNGALAQIMKNRLDLAVLKGCDGVEPDNMDGYDNDSGFALSYDDQLAYNRFIANEAHKRELSIGLKNDLNQINDLIAYYDFSVNEQCHVFSECDYLTPFIDTGKPVLNAEYAQEYVDNTNGERDSMCSDARNRQFKTLVLPLELDDTFRYSCD